MHHCPVLTFQNRTIPRKSPTHLPPLSKVRCCRPKEFGRLPEGLLRRTSPSPQSLQKNDNPSPLANPSKTALSLSLFVGERACPSRCIEPLHPHNLLKAHPSPRPALNLPPLSKGGGLTASHKLSLCCIFTCDTSAFFIHQTFCRQDGGIASPPSLAPHQPFQKPYYPLRIANTLALLAPPVAPNTALAQDDN